MGENETKPDRLSIGERINEVRKRLPYIQKGKGQKEKYSTVKHDQVTAMIRPFLIEQGIIMVIREIYGELKETTKKSSSGTPATIYLARYEVDYCCADNLDDKVTTITSGLGEDFGDKSPGKAISYAVKSSMLKQFNIETGDNEESPIQVQAEAPTLETKTAFDEAFDAAQALGMDGPAAERKWIEWYKVEGMNDLSDQMMIGITATVNAFIEKHEPKEGDLNEPG